MSTTSAPHIFFHDEMYDAQFARTLTASTPAWPTSARRSPPPPSSATSRPPTSGTTPGGPAPTRVAAIADGSRPAVTRAQRAAAGQRVLPPGLLLPAPRPRRPAPPRALRPPRRHVRWRRVAPARRPRRAITVPVEGGDVQGATSSPPTPRARPARPCCRRAATTRPPRRATPTSPARWPAGLQRRRRSRDPAKAPRCTSTTSRSGPDFAPVVTALVDQLVARPDVRADQARPARPVVRRLPRPAGGDQGAPPRRAGLQPGRSPTWAAMSPRGSPAGRCAHGAHDDAPLRRQGRVLRRPHGHPRHRRHRRLLRRAEALQHARRRRPTSAARR